MELVEKHKPSASSVKKILHNISWLVGDKFVEWGFALFVGVWMARYLGPEGLGQLNFAVAFIALCVPLMQLGLTNIVVRELVSHPAESNEIMGTSLALQFVAAILLIAAVNAIVLYFQVNDETTSLFISLLSVTLLFRCVDNIKWWNQSQVQSKYSVWANRTGMVVALTFRLGLILAVAPLETFIWAWILNAVVTACLLLILYQSVYQSLSHWRISRKWARKLLSDSWPLLFTAVASTVYLQIDKVMLGYMATNSDVGIYTAATRISELWYFVPTIIVGTLFPAIIRSSKGDKRTYANRIQALMDLMSLYSLMVIVFLGVFSHSIITLLYGEKFSESGDVLRIHSIAILFVATGACRNRWLIAENRTRFIMFATILGAVANVTLNFLFIPSSQGVGAAWATLFSYGISTYVACLLWPGVNDAFRKLSKSYVVIFRAGLVISFLQQTIDARKSKVTKSN